MTTRIDLDTDTMRLAIELARLSDLTPEQWIEAAVISLAEGMKPAEEQPEQAAE